LLSDISIMLFISGKVKKNIIKHPKMNTSGR